MCIIFFILNENAKDGEYKLILASNRDEHYERPALVAGPWKEDESVIGGRDMEPGREGGTWLAISTKEHTFKFGALLNITGEVRDGEALPRGNIVSDYVKNAVSNNQYCEKLTENGRLFNPFNLVTVEISEKSNQSMHYCSVDNMAHKWPQNEALAFGNSLTKDPLKKVTAGRKKFQTIVNDRKQTKEELIQNLTELLCDRERHWPDDELHRRAPNWGEKLCSICVKMPEHAYGSRTRTIILVDANNKVDFYEETMASTDPDGKWTHTHITTEF